MSEGNLVHTMIAVLLSLLLLGPGVSALAAEKSTVYKPVIHNVGKSERPTPVKAKWWVWALLAGGAVGVVAIVAGSAGGNGNGNGDTGGARVNVPALPSN